MCSRINDTYGHRKGDEVIVNLAKLVRESIRTTDRFGRVGGEEFTVLAPSTDRDQAFLLAEKIRKKVRTCGIIPEKQITISIGISEFMNCDTADKILKRADEALYTAKESGRDRTAIAGDPEEFKADPQS